MSGRVIGDGTAASFARPMSVDEDAMYRKIAWRIVPFAIIGYVIAYIDRVNVGFAKLQFQSDLAFTDAIYGLGAGLFFVGYFIFEIPCNLLLDKFGARATFARIMILWGAISVCMAFVTTPMQFYIMRFLLGAAEAGFFPGIILYFSYWFPNRIRGRVTSVFAMGASIAGILGSPLSGWLMSLDGLHGLRGWQILFIYEGLPAVLLGILCLFLVADRPASVTWLSDEEKALIKRQLDGERQAAIENNSSTLAQAFRNPRVYLLALGYLSIIAATQAVALWTPSLLKDLGVGTTRIGLLTALPFIVAMIGTFLLGRSSDHFRERRWHFACAISAAGLALALVGLAPFSVPVILLAMSIVAAGAWAALAVFWTIPPTILSARAKAGGIAFISSAGAIGGFISPVIIGWASERTGSLFPGLAIIGAMLLCSALLVLLTVKRAAASA
jgi:D-galactonate transporter